MEVVPVLTKVVWSSDWRGLALIELLWIEYSGGGMCYEYRVTFKDGRVVQTEDGYGQGAAAVRAAFDLIVEECI